MEIFVCVFTHVWLNQVPRALIQFKPTVLHDIFHLCHKKKKRKKKYESCPPFQV